MLESCECGSGPLKLNFPLETYTSLGLSWHSKLQIPYIPVPRLPSSNLEIIFSPPLPEDKSKQVETLNDVSVAFNLQGPPYPYTVQEAEGWNRMNIKKLTKALSDVHTYLEKKPNNVNQSLPLPDGCPIGNLRDGVTGEWIGDMGVARWRFEEIVDPKQRDEVIKLNDTKVSGDPTILWSIGYYLNPRYNNLGIATSALGALLSEYLIPVLNVQTIYASAYVGNFGSKRVQEKNGFVEVGRFWTDVKESRGGGRKEHWMMKWERLPKKPLP